jgi:hypothetical protein
MRSAMIQRFRSVLKLNVHLHMLFAALALTWLTPLWAKTTVVDAQSEINDARQDYPLKVLALALTKAEAALLPIRIPIDKGLLGWRIFLVNRAKADQFAAVKTLDGLRPYQAGQGHDWPDTDILRANGLKVQGSANYDGLFKTLQAGRIDYFPRSVVEIWAGEKTSWYGLDHRRDRCFVLPDRPVFLREQEEHSSGKPHRNRLVGRHPGWKL